MNLIRHGARSPLKNELDAILHNPLHFQFNENSFDRGQGQLTYQGQSQHFLLGI